MRCVEDERISKRGWSGFIADGDHRSLLLRGDSGVGKSTLIQRVSIKAAAQGWRVLLSTAVEAEASVIRRGKRLQCGPGDRAERSADQRSRPIRGGRDRA